MDFGYIYKITNPIGQIYIGQTSNIERRKNNYKGGWCKKQKFIYRSIKHYGWDNHKFEIIFKNKNSLLSIDIIEIFFIEFFNSYYNNNKLYGLNLTVGGKGTTKLVHTEYSKELIRNYSIKRAKNKGVLHLHTQEAIEKRSAKKRLTIYQFDISGKFIKEWDGIVNVAKFCNKTHANTMSFLKGVHLTTNLGGYLWSYTKSLDFYYKRIEELKEKRIKFYKKGQKSIIQLTKNNIFIKEWPSISKITEELEIPASNISGLLTGSNKKSRYVKGYKWVYAEEYYKQQNNNNSSIELGPLAE